MTPRDYWLEQWEKEAMIDFYVTPADKLAGRAVEINAQRDRWLEEARAKRKQKRSEKRNEPVASQVA